MPNTERTSQVEATDAALEAIARLRAERGPLMFFQSGGCCDGSLPMCFDLGEMLIGDHDVYLGDVGGCPFYIDGRQYEAWNHPDFTLDVAPGSPEGFSLPAGPGFHFVATVHNADSPFSPQKLDPRDVTNRGSARDDTVFE